MSTQRGARVPRRISVVIPATEVDGLEPTLVSVLEHRPAGTEVIVALAFPYDDPWNIREEVTFVDAPRGSGLVGCANAGVAAAPGEVIHVLAAGWRACPGWIDAATRHFERPDVAAVVPLAVADGPGDRIVSAGVRRTVGGASRTVRPRPDSAATAEADPPSAPMLEAGFWRADVLREVGFSAACGDALAAADMAAALAALRQIVVLEHGSRVVGGPEPASASAFRAGLWAERLFWRSLVCDRPVAASLAHVGEVVRHAVATAPAGTLGMLAGRLLALVQFGSCLGRARQLRNMMQRSIAGDHDGEPSVTVRIDGPHDPRPHLDAIPPALRRSA